MEKSEGDTFCFKIAAEIPREGVTGVFSKAEEYIVDPVSVGHGGGGSL